MAVQTQAELATATGADVRMELPAGDRGILHDLATKVGELAALPVQETKRNLWYAHNDLAHTRPIVFCDPENGWAEIIPPSHLQCVSKLGRDWEMRLRKQIFWGTRMGDDHVIEPFFDIGYGHTDSGWGVRETRIGGEHGGAYTWEVGLPTYDDMARMHYPTITVDHAATNALLDLAGQTLGHALTVRLRGSWWWTLGLTWTLANMRGMEQLMLDMYDEPANLHRLMAFLRDGTMARIEFLEANGLLAPNHDGSYVGSGGLGYTRQLSVADPKHVLLRERWGFAESQETVGIAPEMFEEFVFPYQYPLLDRFGLNCYGCCEPVHNRWHVIKKLPRLRRISCSPWVDLEQMAANLGPHYVFSWKPNPAHIAVPHIDEDLVRKTIRRTIEITRAHDCRLEMVMKDNNTLGGNPNNAPRWCQIAREEAERG